MGVITVTFAVPAAGVLDIRALMAHNKLSGVNSVSLHKTLTVLRARRPKH